MGLSDIGLDFCRAGSELVEDFERGSPKPSFSRTHLSARDTTSLPGPALSVDLESAVSEEVHSYPDSE